MDRVAIIVPCCNEEAVLSRFYARMQAVLGDIGGCAFEMLFIDDGSRDGTLSIMRKLAKAENHVSYVSLSRNFGKEAAMLAGLDQVDADAAIIMDADLQHPPEMIPQMIGYWHEGYDDVCARRIDRQDEGIIKRNLTDFFYFCLQKCSRFEVQRNVGDFRLLDRRCIMALRLMREEQRYTKGMFTWVGYRKKEIPFKVQPRAAGKTNWNYLSLLSLALEGLTSFTTAPLRLASMLGIFVSMLAIAYMVFVLGNALLYGDPVAGYPTLLTVLLFLGGVQLMSLGIIGEYMGRVFNESKRRPLYLIDEKNGKRVAYDEGERPRETRCTAKRSREDDHAE